MTETVTIIIKDLPENTINMLYKGGSPGNLVVSCHILMAKMNIDKLD